MSIAESGEKSDPARQTQRYLAVGRIIRPHGVRGALLVDQISGQLLALKAGDIILVGEDRSTAIYRELRRHGGRWLLWLEGVESREQAESMRGKVMALPLEDVAPLPEGTYYHWQILGANVVSDQGEDLGTIGEIIETGANDVYIVRDAGGKELLIPAIESVILEVDLEERRLMVHLIPGLRD